MKLASLNDGSPGGLPVVVSMDLTRCAPATSIVASLVEALDRWNHVADRLWSLAVRLETGRERAWRFHPHEALSPVPRAEIGRAGCVALRPALTSLAVPPEAGLIRSRFDVHALAGSAGRSRLLVLTVVLEGGVQGSDSSEPIVACSPVAFTLDALDEGAEPERPVVSRLCRDREGEVEEQVRHVGRADLLPGLVPRGAGCRLVPLPGIDGFGMTGLRDGDVLRASITDCRCRSIVGTIQLDLRKGVQARGDGRDRSSWRRFVSDVASVWNAGHGAGQRFS